MVLCGALAVHSGCTPSSFWTDGRPGWCWKRVDFGGWTLCFVCVTGALIVCINRWVDDGGSPAEVDAVAQDHGVKIDTPLPGPPLQCAALAVQKPVPECAQGSQPPAPVALLHEQDVKLESLPEEHDSVQASLPKADIDAVALPVLDVRAGVADALALPNIPDMGVVSCVPDTNKAANLIADVIASPPVPPEEGPTPQRDHRVQPLLDDHISPLPLHDTPMGLPSTPNDLLWQVSPSTMWDLGLEAPPMLSPGPQPFV